MKAVDWLKFYMVSPLWVQNPTSRIKIKILLIFLLNMKIYIGSDHRGNELRSKLVFYVIELGYECKDLGTNNDFPLISQEVTKRVLEYNDSKGILICGTGQGMAMD
jgi:hypothetical protein